MALGLAACAKAPAPAVPSAPPPPPAEIRDLVDLPQDPAAYLDPRTEERPFLDPAQSAQATQRFLEQFFSPWSRTRPAYALQEVARPFRSFAQKTIFGENTLPRPPAWTAALEAEAALESYPSLGRKAVTLRRTDLRQMPTDRPVFYDFAKAGEGFPFDYLQNSAVWAGTPCYVTHATRDRSWYLCETPVALGWVRAQDLAFTDSRFEAAFRTGSLAVVVAEDVALIDGAGTFRFRSGVGAVHPLAASSGNSLDLLVPASDENGNALLKRAALPLGQAMPLPLSPTPRNVALLARRMMESPARADYGWGGLFGDRDCSALQKDLFAAFGLWLPRNSASQAKAGAFVPLDALSPREREQAILQSGVPFATLVAMPGHILLYIGQRNGRAVMLHNIWGVRTRDPEKGEGRRVIGRMVVTTLEPGLELPNVDPKTTLLNRVKGMTLLAKPGSGLQPPEETEAAQ